MLIPKRHSRILNAISLRQFKIRPEVYICGMSKRRIGLSELVSPLLPLAAMCWAGPLTKTITEIWMLLWLPGCNFLWHRWHLLLNIVWIGNTLATGWNAKNRNGVALCNQGWMDMGTGIWDSKKYILNAVNASLRRLQTDYIDFIQSQRRGCNTARRNPGGLSAAD